MVKTYSLAVIAGLEKLPAGERVSLESLAIPATRVSKVLKGHVELSDRELDLIEQASWKTAGQLAASASEPNGGPFTDVAELGSRVHKAAQGSTKGQRQPAKRPAKPRRVTQRHLV